MIAWWRSAWFIRPLFHAEAAACIRSLAALAACRSSRAERAALNFLSAVPSVTQIKFNLFTLDETPGTTFLVRAVTTTMVQSKKVQIPFKWPFCCRKTRDVNETRIHLANETRNNVDHGGGVAENGKVSCNGRNELLPQVRPKARGNTELAEFQKSRRICSRRSRLDERSWPRGEGTTLRDDEETVWLACIVAEISIVGEIYRGAPTMRRLYAR